MHFDLNSANRYLFGLCSFSSQKHIPAARRQLWAPLSMAALPVPDSTLRQLEFALTPFFGEPHLGFIYIS